MPSQLPLNPPPAFDTCVQRRIAVSSPTASPGRFIAVAALHGGWVDCVVGIRLLPVALKICGYAVTNCGNFLAGGSVGDEQPMFDFWMIA